MKQIKRFLFIFHLIVGVGGVFGGVIGIISPDGSAVGMTTDVLRNGPFSSFLIPSVFLLIMLGIGNLIAAVTAKLDVPYHAYISGSLGVILCMWIIIQCYVMWAVAILHIIFFVIGLIQLSLSITLAFKKKLFPTQYIVKLLSKN